MNTALVPKKNIFVRKRKNQKGETYLIYKDSIYMFDAYLEAVWESVNGENDIKLIIENIYSSFSEGESLNSLMQKIVFIIQKLAEDNFIKLQ